MPEIIPHLVSTIIPVRNRPQLLKEAVESVLAQTHRAIELLIVDHGSTDDTPAMAEALTASYPEIVRPLIRNPPLGPGPAREAGRMAARGEFIQYLDSDDLLRPTKFEVQVKALRNHPDCDISYGYICVHKQGLPPSTQPFKASGETRSSLFPWILSDRWWNTDAPLWRRSLCDTMGPWCDLRWSQDWEYDGRAGSLGAKLVHVKEFVCDERHHAANRNTVPANWMETERLLSRKRFFELMLGHAETARVASEDPCCQHFARWVFHVTRQAAAAGQVVIAKELFELADRAAGGIAATRKGFSLFQISTRVLGWELAGRLWLSPLTKWKKPGKLTQEQSFARPVQ
jgi:glycosyltransferase involved in cell wall biosynthesis